MIDWITLFVGIPPSLVVGYIVNWWWHKRTHRVILNLGKSDDMIMDLKGNGFFLEVTNKNKISEIPPFDIFLVYTGKFKESVQKEKEELDLLYAKSGKKREDGPTLGCFEHPLSDLPLLPHQSRKFVCYLARHDNVNFSNYRNDYRLPYNDLFNWDEKLGFLPSFDWTLRIELKHSYSHVLYEDKKLAQKIIRKIRFETFPAIDRAISHAKRMKEMMTIRQVVKKLEH